MIKIAIFGNRSITDKELIVSKFIDYTVNLDSENGIVVLHGGADGPPKFIVDAMHEMHGTTDVLFKPWTMVWSKLTFEPIYFYLRNKQIVENADKVVVFTNGERDSEVYRVINLCERWDKDLTIIEV